MSEADVAPLTLVELGDVCARMRARNLDLFEALGAHVADVDDPALQRLVAEAAHRHAWHADLWAARSPAIPPIDADRLTARHRAPAPPAPIDGDAYAAELDRLLDELASLRARVDGELDPSTVRVVTLVTADLTELRGRLG